MTQYKRITGKVFGGNATATGNDPQIAQFGSALAGTFVGTTDPETIQSLSAWGQGWIGAVTPETQFPPMPEMTGAMNVLSHQICGILQQGISTWDSGTVYYTGNFCSKNGIVYVSLSDTNQGNDPEADTINWRSYGGADIDLSNLSSQGKNIANWSTNVTNCITEIPQRIKLDLSNGTLTLKAGSVVIIPNGFEADGTTPKFDYITIANDLSYPSSGTAGVTYEFFLFYNITDKALGVRMCTSCTSGTTAPNYTTYLGWYDTNENKIKNSNNSGSTWDTYLSLPVAQMTSVDGTWTKINQIFNGIGYIGSTVWVDKDVKCLIPDGRNEDGTLKNIEITTNNVAMSTSSSTQDYTIRLSDSGSLSQRQTRYNLVVSNLEQLYKLDTSIAYYVYVISENKAFLTSGSQWVQSLSTPIATATLTQGAVSNFNPKQPFRAVDYNDYTKDLDTKVNKTGDTMTGDLKIAKDDYSRVILQNTTGDRDVAPTTNAGTAGFLISDKNGNTIAAFSNERYTDGRNTTKVQAVGKDGTTATFRVTAHADGTQSCEFPKCTTQATTSSSATSTRVAVIIQNYLNGYAWMRKWSDGWIEQGGRMTVKYEQNVTTNFVVPFSNTNYYVTASPLNWQNIDDNVNVTGLTTKSCVLYGTGIGNAGGWSTAVAVWRACGY